MLSHVMLTLIYHCVLEDKCFTDSITWSPQCSWWGLVLAEECHEQWVTLLREMWFVDWSCMKIFHGLNFCGRKIGNLNLNFNCFTDSYQVNSKLAVSAAENCHPCSPVGGERHRCWTTARGRRPCTSRRHSEERFNRDGGLEESLVAGLL